MPKQDSAKFISGLITGLSVGSLLAYFATPQGKKTWLRLEKEWEKARQSLYDEGLIAEQNLSLQEFRDNFLTDLKHSFFNLKDQFELLNLKQEQKKTARALQKKKLRRKKKQQFRGV